MSGGMERPKVDLEQLSTLLEELERLLRSHVDAPAALCAAAMCGSRFLSNRLGLDGTQHIKSALRLGLVPKAARVTQLVLQKLGAFEVGRLSQEALRAAMAGLGLLDGLGVLFYEASTLLRLKMPMKFGDPSFNAAAKLLTQLSDAPTLQAFTEGAKLVGRLIWRMPVVHLPRPGAAAAIVQPVVRMSPTGVGRQYITLQNYTTHTTGANFLMTASAAISIVMLAVSIMDPDRDLRAPLELDRLRALRRLTASLQHSRVLPALCSELLAALPPPTCAAPGAGIETAACCTCALESLNAAFSAFSLLLSPAGWLDGPTTASVVQVFLEPEVQQLLAAEVELAGELMESDAGGGGGGQAGAQACGRGAGEPSSDDGSRGQGSSRRSGRSRGGGGSGGVRVASNAVRSTSLLDGRAASGRAATAEEDAAVLRWAAARAGMAVWHICMTRAPRASAPLLPPAQRLAALSLQLARCMQLSPPPVTNAVAQPAHLAHLSEMCFSCGVPVYAVVAYLRHGDVTAAEREVLLPAVLEAWALSLRAQVGGARRLLSEVGPDQMASADMQRCLRTFAIRLFPPGDHLAEAWQVDSATGWLALGPAARQEAAQRLAGAGLLRTLDSLLRLVSALEDKGMLRTVVVLVEQWAGAFLLPVSRVLLRLPPLPAADPLTARSSRSSGTVPPPPSPPYPPPLPAPAWDAVRDLGLLLSAAKLLVRKTEPLQQALVAITEDLLEGHPALSMESTFLHVLMDMLSVSGPADSGLEALLTDMEGAGRAGSSASDTGGHGHGINRSSGGGGATLGIAALCIRSLFLSCARFQYWAAFALPFYMHVECSDRLGYEVHFHELQIAASGMAAVRFAARQLPPDAFLRTQPLLVLGLVAVALHSVLSDPDGQGVQRAERVTRADSDMRPEEEAAARLQISEAGRGMARGLVETLEALSADPALAPIVRTWLLPPPQAGGEADAERPDGENADRARPAAAAAAEAVPERAAASMQPADRAAGAALQTDGRAEAAAVHDAACAAAEPVRPGGVWWFPHKGGIEVDIAFAVTAVALHDPEGAQRLEALSQQAAAAAAAQAADAPPAEVRLAPAGRPGSPSLLESLPSEQRQLWPERLLRVCCNPGCVNLEGESEHALRLRACAGCGAARYCGAACQKQHWRDGGHREECAALQAAKAAAAAGGAPPPGRDQ